MDECDERASERISRGEKEEKASVVEREGEGEYERARRHTGSPRLRDTHACRPAGRPASDAVSRFAPITARDDAL